MQSQGELMSAHTSCVWVCVCVCVFLEGRVQLLSCSQVRVRCVRGAAVMHAWTRVRLRVHMCWCVWARRRKQSDVREGGGGDGGTKMASWHAGQACTSLSAHPSLSFLRVLPVSACMCASGFQLKWLRNIAGSNHRVTAHRGPVCVRRDRFYVPKNVRLLVH